MPMRDVAPNDAASAAHICSPTAAAVRRRTELPLALSLLLEALEPKLQQVLAAVGADAAGVHLVGDEAQPSLRLYAQQGLSADEEHSAAMAPMPDTLVGRCVTAGVPVQRGAEPDPGSDGAEWEAAPSAFVAVPLQVDQLVIGALWALSHQQRLVEGAGALLELVAQPLAELVLQHFLLAQVGGERQEHQLLADHLRDAIWTLEVEPRLRTVLISDSITRLTGYSPQDFRDDPHLWVSMIYPDDRAKVVAEVQSATEGHADEIHHRVRLVRQDGEMRWVHTSGRVVRDDGAVRIYGLTTDVTDHVRLEERVRRADRLSAVGMLAGGIAHEYNNLHFAILGTLDLLLMRDDLDDGVRQHINRVRETAERASEITTKLVSFARGGTGGREDFDVAELLDSALTLVSKEFSTMGIQVEVMNSPLPLRLHGNRAELGQALINLIINAQQAMQDCPTKRLTLTTGLDPDRRVFVSVADTGHGIPPENLPRLFDPFFTTKGAAGSWVEDRAATDAFLSGRGLGLSVAQTIVQEHGGDIEVESELDCGTKFTIYLPTPHLAQQVPTEDRPLPQAESGRILIADDEDAVRLVCREMLRQLNYQVAEAGGGEEALRLLHEQPFDLILVDLQMPDMSGLELMRRINELPAEVRPAKLVITGNIDEVPPETCAELGISGLLQKRGNLSELVSKVQLALSFRRT